MGGLGRSLAAGAEKCRAVAKYGSTITQKRRIERVPEGKCTQSARE